MYCAYPRFYHVPSPAIQFYTSAGQEAVSQQSSGLPMRHTPPLGARRSSALAAVQREALPKFPGPAAVTLPKLGQASKSSVTSELLQVDQVSKYDEFIDFGCFV